MYYLLTIKQLHAPSEIYEFKHQTEINLIYLALINIKIILCLVMVNKLYVLMIDLVNQCRHLVVKNAVYSCVEKIFEEVQYSKK